MPTETGAPATDLALVDHHCHGVVTAELDRAGFEAIISESYRPPPEGATNFDKPLGLLVRRWCAPLLDLEPFCDADDYIARRQALGSAEVSRRFLRASGLDRLLIDTGHRADEVAGVDEMAEIAGRPAHEVVRIEAVLESVARRGTAATTLAAETADDLAHRAERAVGLKSIVAYRTTFRIPQSSPTGAEVVDAAGRWLRKNEAESRVRQDDPTLERFLLWTAAELCRDRRLPLQLHVGVGDPDITLHACDPTHFTEFIRAMEAWQVAVTLLHCYPFQREAGWLAEIFRNVYFDVGFVMHFTGPSAADIVGEALEMGPFFKQLYSSDAFGLAEFYYLGQLMFRRGFAERLAKWIADDMCTAAEAEAIFAKIAAGNARRIYPIPKADS